MMLHDLQPGDHFQDEIEEIKIARHAECCWRVCSWQENGELKSHGIFRQSKLYLSLERGYLNAHSMKFD